MRESVDLGLCLTDSLVPIPAPIPKTEKEEALRKRPLGPGISCGSIASLG